MGSPAVYKKKRGDGTSKSQQVNSTFNFKQKSIRSLKGLVGAGK